MKRWLEHVRKVDLGSGPRPKAGFVGLDSNRFALEPPHEVWEVDLASGVPWPLADGQVTELYSSHLIEHLPAGTVSAYEFIDVDDERSNTPARSRFRQDEEQTPARSRFREEQDALFWFMDECYRIAAPGARFELRWPALVDRRLTPPRWLATAFVDPTHRRFIPTETLQYFTRAGRAALGVSNYAVRCDWHLIGLYQGELGGGHVENIAELVRGSADERASAP